MKKDLKINKKKSEYMVFGNNGKGNLPLEDDYVSGVDICKYLGVLFTKKGKVKCKERKKEILLDLLNSILWDESLRKITKKRIYKTMVQNITIHGAKRGI
jgi:hypothetical protein